LIKNNNFSQFCGWSNLEYSILDMLRRVGRYITELASKITFKDG